MDQIRSEEFTVRATDADLPAVLSYHESVAPANCVVLCHGMGSSRDDLLLRSISDGLLSGGASAMPLATVRFTFSQGRSNLFSGYESSERPELDAVIDHLRERMGRKVIAVAGHSKGATVAALHAASRPAVSHKEESHDPFCICSISGRFDLRAGVSERLADGEALVAEIMRSADRERLWHAQMRPRPGKPDRTFDVSRAQLEERFGIDLGEAVSKVQAPMLIIHGTEDEVIPFADAGRLAEAYGDGEVAVVAVEGADHNFRGEGMSAQVAQALGEFIATHCAASP